MILVGEFKIDVESAKVYQGETLLEIEPQTYKLLLHFVNNPQVIIDRDALIETLWAGRVVSENTINKHIGNLRKVLNDNPKQAKYIETVSKRGYRLVCDVEIDGSINALNLPKQKIHMTVMITVTILIVIMALVIFIPTLIKSKSDISVESFEVTRLVGLEFSPKAFPNKNEILFLRQDSTQPKNELWYKNLDTNVQKKVNVGDIELYKLVDITDNSGLQTVYFEGKGLEQCYLYKAHLSSIDMLSEFEPMFECQSFQLYDVVYSKVEDAFYYTALKKGDLTAQVYKFEVSKNSHELVRQPSILGSNLQNLDISPDGQKLLFMSVDYKRHTTFYSLDIQTNELTKHKTVNYLITEAIWAHDSEHIFYSAAPPSHELLRSKPDDINETRVVNVSHYLSSDLALLLSNQLLYATRQVNFVNEMIFSKSQIPIKPNNSIVYDVIPALFHHQRSYLFISNRTGKNQLYKGDLLTGNAEILSNLPVHYVFLSMQISPDDRHFLLANQNSVWRVPIVKINDTNKLIDNLTPYKVFENGLPIYNVNWLSNKHYVVSTKHHEKPHVIFDEDSPTELTIPSKWKYAFVNHSHLGSIYLVEKATGQIYRSNSTTFLEGKDIEIYEVDKLRANMPFAYFDPQIAGEKIYFITTENKSFYLNHLSLSEERNDSRQSLNGYYKYDANKTGLMISHLQEIQGDVHRAVIN